MQRFKICPGCGEHNSPNMLECLTCETDLTSVRTTDEEEENMYLNNDNKVASDKDGYVRICDCGYFNSANARKCKVCGENISDIAPIQKNINIIFTPAIVSLDQKYIFEISDSEIIIGREEQMKEYLVDRCYVSRQHAKINKESGKIFIENLSKINFTFINNEKITEKKELKIGDEIGLGGNEVNGKRQDGAAYFVVRNI